MIKQSSPRRTRAKADEEAQAQPIPETNPVSPKGATKMSPLAVGLIVVVLIAAALLLLKNGVPKPAQVQKSGTTQTNASDQSVPSATQAEIQELIAKVASHIPVKQDEAPTVATIQNADMLRAQNPVFYKDAQIGDRLLIWSNQAVLYSPSTDAVLSILPISLPSNASAGTSSSMASGTVALAEQKIEVRNGSGVVGKGKTMATKLDAAGFTVMTATNALSKTPYEKSIIIQTDTSDAGVVSKLQQITGASVVTTPPAVEGKPKGDILLIVGLDAEQ